MLSGCQVMQPSASMSGRHNGVGELLSAARSRGPLRAGGPEKTFWRQLDGESAMVFKS